VTEQHPIRAIRSSGRSFTRHAAKPGTARPFCGTFVGYSPQLIRREDWHGTDESFITCKRCQKLATNAQAFAVQTLAPFDEWTTEWIYPTRREAEAKMEAVISSSTYSAHRVRVEAI